MAFWVIGGEYADTEFRTLAKGRTEERIGPFATWEEARSAWSARAFATVDDCHSRFRIVEEADQSA
ncbi:hypothetical protein STAQ_46690 [Allostella sp. ATCC 35155]|nr:hypothetical protein STAQ_46690 [Stella sp. ATCC 35155]